MGFSSMFAALFSFYFLACSSLEISRFSCLLTACQQLRFYLMRVFNFQSGLSFPYKRSFQLSSSNQNCILFKFIQSFRQFHSYQSRNSIYCFSLHQYTLKISMKKVKSPLKQTLTYLFQAYQNKQSKQMPIILNRTHEQEHKRSANSIKKVLKELQQLKKELKDIKTVNRQESIPQQLDNSKCRKLNAQTKRSSPSPHSHSSSKHKTSQQQQTSTQTKRIKRQINEFSFSIHEPTNRSHKPRQSEEEDSVQYNPFSSKLRKDTTKHVGTQSRSNLKVGKDNIKESRIQMIEAAQQYERHLNLLKTSFQILPISSNVFSSQDKLKLNIQMERMSNQIRRVPIYMQNPEQYYEIAAMYARSLNNQLNNLAVILNRTTGRTQLREKTQVENNTEQKVITICQNCEDSYRKEWERFHRKEVKRIQREAHKIATNLEKAKEDINILTTQNLILMREKDEWKSRDKSYQARFVEEQGKVKLLKQEILHLQDALQDLESQRQKEAHKNKLQEEDLNYYKLELEKMKKNIYQRESKVELAGREQQHSLVAQLKEKEQLYQSIIKDKENIIQQLKKTANGLHQQLAAVRSSRTDRYHKAEERSERSNDSEFYHLKLENEEKNRLIAEQLNDIDHWKTQAKNYQQKSKEFEHSLQQYTQEINRLNAQIEALEESNEKLRDKNLKTKVKIQSKLKKEVQNKGKKGQAFEQINELIQHHKKNIENDH